MVESIFNCRKGETVPTTLKIGGPAELFCRPRGIWKTLRCCEVLNGNDTPYRILDGGSNLLADDLGVKGAVVRPGYDPEELVIEGNRVEAPAGMRPVVRQRRGDQFGGGDRPGRVRAEGLVAALSGRPGAGGVFSELPPAQLHRRRPRPLVLLLLRLRRPPVRPPARPPEFSG